MYACFSNISSVIFFIYLFLISYLLLPNLYILLINYFDFETNGSFKTFLAVTRVNTKIYDIIFLYS